jgi:hypothetical protein
MYNLAPIGMGRASFRLAEIIQVSFIICMLALLLMPLGGLHFCVGLDFVIP